MLPKLQEMTFQDESENQQVKCHLMQQRFTKSLKKANKFDCQRLCYLVSTNFTRKKCCPVCCLSGLKFTKNPANLTVTQGNMARLGCAVEGLIEPEIMWMKDGEKLYSMDQMYITIDTHHWETYHRYECCRDSCFVVFLHGSQT